MSGQRSIGGCCLCAQAESEAGLEPSSMLLGCGCGQKSIAFSVTGTGMYLARQFHISREAHVRRRNNRDRRLDTSAPRMR